jgi:ribosomal-protein-alanine N-acetyltransferase
MSDYEVWKKSYTSRLPALNRFDRGPSDPKKCSLAQFKKLVERHAELAKADKVYIYGIFERKSGSLIGAIDIAIIAREMYQMANLGYQIHNRYWGSGYGSEATIAALKIGFTQLALNRLEASIDFDNKRSIALAKKIKMRNEGIKKNYLFEHGGWVDQIIYVANPVDIGLRAKKPLKW